MSLREDITCNYCSDIFVDPVILSCCGESVCKSHADEFISNSVTICPLCKEDLPSDMKCPINKALQRLLERETNKINIDSYRAVLDALKDKIQITQSLKSNAEKIISKKYTELKDKVNYDQNEAKTQIDAVAQDLTNKIEAFENESNASLEKSTELFDKMRSMLADFEKFIKSLRHTEDEKRAKSQQIQDSMSKFEAEFQENTTICLSVESIIYEPMKASDISDIFGKLTKTNPAENQEIQPDEIQLIHESEFNAAEIKLEPETYFIDTNEQNQLVHSLPVVHSNSKNDNSHLMILREYRNLPSTSRMASLEAIPKAEPPKIDNLPKLTSLEQHRLKQRFQNLRRNWQERRGAPISPELINMSEGLIFDGMEIKTRYYKIPVGERKNLRLVCEFCNLNFGTYLFSSHYTQCKHNENGLKNHVHLLDMKKCSFCNCHFKYKLDKIKVRLRHYASCIKKLYGFH